MVSTNHNLYKKFLISIYIIFNSSVGFSQGGNASNFCALIGSKMVANSVDQGWQTFTVSKVLYDSEIKQSEIEAIKVKDVGIGDSITVQTVSGESKKLVLLGRFIDPSGDALLVLNPQTLKPSYIAIDFLLKNENSMDNLRDIPAFSSTTEGQNGCQICAAHAIQNLILSSKLQAMIRKSPEGKPDSGDLMDLLYVDNEGLAEKIAKIIYLEDSELPRLDLDVYHDHVNKVASEAGYKADSTIDERNFNIIFEHLKNGPAIVNYKVPGAVIGHSVLGLGIAQTDLGDHIIIQNSSGLGGITLVPMKDVWIEGSFGIKLSKIELEGK